MMACAEENHYSWWLKDLGSRRVVVSTNWLVLGAGGWLISTCGPPVNHGFTGLVGSTILGLQLKHSWGLDVTFSFTTLSLGSIDPKALFLNLFKVDQGLIVLRAWWLRKWMCKEKEAGESGCWIRPIKRKEKKGEKVIVKTWSFYTATIWRWSWIVSRKNIDSQAISPPITWNPKRSNSGITEEFQTAEG